MINYLIELMSFFFLIFSLSFILTVSMVGLFIVAYLLCIALEKFINSRHYPIICTFFNDIKSKIFFIVEIYYIKLLKPNTGKIKTLYNNFIIFVNNLYAKIIIK